MFGSHSKFATNDFSFQPSSDADDTCSELLKRVDRLLDAGATTIRCAGTERAADGIGKALKATKRNRHASRADKRVDKIGFIGGSRIGGCKNDRDGAKTKASASQCAGGWQNPASRIRLEGIKGRNIAAWSRLRLREPSPRGPTVGRIAIGIAIKTAPRRDLIECLDQRFWPITTIAECISRQSRQESAGEIRHIGFNDRLIQDKGSATGRFQGKVSVLFKPTDAKSKVNPGEFALQSQDDLRKTGLQCGSIRFEAFGIIEQQEDIRLNRVGR